MTENGARKNEARKEIIAYWIKKATDALESARSELRAGRLDFSVNRAYYACFYAASAVLLKEGKKFVKHSGLRGSVHRDLVKSGLLDPKWGKVFDRVFENRQSADYVAMWDFDLEQVREMLKETDGFVQQMEQLLKRKS